MTLRTRYRRIKYKVKSAIALKRLRNDPSREKFTCPICEMDVRVGGAYRFVMRAPRGDHLPCKGFFREIVKPERLVMSMDLSNPWSCGIWQ